MRIAFAIEHYSPGQGGAERYAWGLSQWLIRNGHDVCVFAAKASPESGARILRVPKKPRSLRPARFAKALAEALRNESFDIVHAFNHAWPCDVLRLGGGVHLAFEEYNVLTSPPGMRRFLKRLSHRLLPWYRALRENERRQFDNPTRHFIAISQKVAEDMARFYPHVRDRICLIRNGVDLNAFNPQMVERRRPSARRDLSLSEETLALLFASNNFRLKGLRDLIDALPAVIADSPQPVQLIVAGRGDVAPFERQAERRGVRSSVRFCGHTDDLAAKYAAADALVHPSYYDAFGFVCLEAMACGLPVLVSRNCGVSEIVMQSRANVLIDMPCSGKRLAEAVLRTLDIAVRGDASVEQWRVAKENSIDRNYDAVLDLYRRVIASRK